MTEPIRIAFLSYFFPPIGGGGTPRSVKFVKYLPGCGYRPLVLTVGPDEGVFSREFQRDDGQFEELRDIPFDLVQVPHPARHGIQKRLWQSSRFPWIWAGAYPWFYDDARPWAYAAAKRLLVEAERRPFSLIYATAGPNSTLVAAAKAARRLEVPWVADLRDLWTVDSLKTFPSRLHYLWLSGLERRTLRSAAAVIANTPIAGERLRVCLGSRFADRVHVIPNGFDPAEFEAHPLRQRQRREPITLVHAGTLYEPGKAASRLGRYRPFDLDNSARSVQPLVEGLKAVHAHSPEIGARFHVRLLGYAPECSRSYIADSGVSDQVVCEGVRPRREAMAAISEASALLVLQVAFADSDKPVPYVPGKVYEYLATGNPIVAPVPPGDLRNLLDNTANAYVADYRRPEEVAKSLCHLARDYDADCIPRCKPHWLSMYSRVELAKHLAGVFDQVVRNRPAISE